MAYIIGIVTPKEKAELEERGWELEPAPKELVPDEATDGEMYMCFVDSSMFEVMSGPDWDGGKPDQTTVTIAAALVRLNEGESVDGDQNIVAMAEKIVNDNDAEVVA